MNKGKYWYRKVIEVCVICGKEKKSKERVYWKQHATTILLDYACNEHFI